MNISTKVKIQSYKYTVSTFVLLKLVTTIFYQILIFSPNDSPSKTIKNVFYFIEKALFVLEISKFLFLFHTFQIQKDKWKWNNL